MKTDYNQKLTSLGEKSEKVAGAFVRGLMWPFVMASKPFVRFAHWINKVDKNQIALNEDDQAYLDWKNTQSK